MPKDKDKNKGKGGAKKSGFIQAIVSAGISLYSNKEMIADKISKVYSNIYGEDREFDLAEVKHNFVTLGRLIKAYSRGDYRDISAATFFKIATAAAYAGLGKDLIPDDIPGFGVVDDIAMISWALAGVIKEIEKFEEWESQHVSEELEIQTI
jgi:uncharacterized membrane protein YkvA (DUF1232 family)